MTDAPGVAFQGEPGAFSEEAALGFFGESVAVHPVPTWRAVFEAVASDGDDAGVVAIESSLAGSIRETYDLLSEFYDRGVRIVGEVECPGPPRARRAARPVDRLDRAGLQPRPGPCPGRRVPPQPRLAGDDDLQHGRCGADDRRRPRAGRRPRSRHRASPGYTASRSSPTTSRAATRTGRGSPSLPSRVRAPPPEPPTPGNARQRSSSPSATCRARCTAASARSRRAASTSRGWSRGPPGPPAGSTTSGSTSTPTPQTRRARPRSTISGRRPRWSASSARTRPPRED